MSSSTSQPDRLVSARIIAQSEHGRAMAWVNTALRTRTPVIAEALAAAITDGRMTAGQLSKHVLSGDRDRAGLGVERPDVTAALGTIWVASGSSPENLAAGQRLLRAVANSRPAVLTRVQQQVYAQASFLAGQLDDVRSALRQLPNIPQHTVHSLRTDLLHPTVARRTVPGAWGRRLAAPFRDSGLAPVVVRRGTATLFDGLGAAQGPAVDGPLVSVVMPCYRPDTALLTSLTSILHQSYQNLEVLLVDDGSGPSYADLFEQARALDPRVRLRRLPRNGGTYVARNAALTDARGTFVTVQDADDWSHPERIAHQVAALIENPSAGGSRSDAIRATDELLHQWVGYSPRRPNASSLMFRRDDLERTGPFDSVRKSGDSEFHERLTTVVGPVVDTRTPLAVTRLRTSSLSRADFAFSWMSADRLLYRSAYRSWHRALASTAPADVPGLLRGPRPFPAPRALLRDHAARADDSGVELLIVLDSSHPEAPVELAELSRAAAGLCVGVLHAEDPTRGRGERPEPSDQLMALAREGGVRLMSPTDSLAARVTVVLHAGIFELVSGAIDQIRTEEVVVAVRPWRTGTEMEDHLTVADTCLEVCGMRPTWAAVRESHRRQLAADGWELPLVSSVVDRHTPAGR